MKLPMRSVIVLRSCDIILCDVTAAHCLWSSSRVSGLLRRGTISTFPTLTITEKQLQWCAIKLLCAVQGTPNIIMQYSQDV